MSKACFPEMPLNSPNVLQNPPKILQIPSNVPPPMFSIFLWIPFKFSRPPLLRYFLRIQKSQITSPRPLSTGPPTGRTAKNVVNYIKSFSLDAESFFLCHFSSLEAGYLTFSRLEPIWAQNLENDLLFAPRPPKTSQKYKAVRSQATQNLEN